jgi:hypothetical protein
MANHSSAEQPKEEYKHYYVDAKVISLDASQSLESYRSHGSGSGSPGSTLNYSTSMEKVRIVLTVESNLFYADVTIQDRKAADQVEGQKQRIELTNLRPTFLTMGTEENGRSYQLNLAPRVVSVQLSPVSFRKAADDLYRIKFRSSRILLNNKHYIGRMDDSDAEVFSVEICGMASLEFALHHLKDAEPWGRLQNGKIAINHPEGNSIEIGNVTNGEGDQLIDGGPYVVWVRWKNPHQSVDEYRAELSAYRESVTSGDATPTAGTLEIINRELAREPGPWVVSTGARGIRKSEIVGSE